MTAPRVVSWSEMEPIVAGLDLEASMREGFIAYSAGRCVVPPVGELQLKDPPGDVHIKYGYIEGDEFYVVKIASGFAENGALGLSTSNGLMLLFRQRTGEVAGVLLDEGRLTDLRTAAAGAVSARALGPKRVSAIGILGTGLQARLQLRFLRPVTDCREVWVWGRRAEARQRFQQDLNAEGFTVHDAETAAQVAEHCNLIVTTTAATEPLLSVDAVRAGTHITAMGSDTPGKQELDAAILGRADRVVADSKSQCLLRGEIAHALQQDTLTENTIVELGEVLAGHRPGREDEAQITVADLTGVAVQDVQIATAVLRGITG